MLAGDIAGANSLLRIGQEGEQSAGCPNHSGTALEVWRHGGKDVPLQELPGNGAAGGRRRRQVVRRHVPGEEPRLAFRSQIQALQKVALLI